MRTQWLFVASVVLTALSGAALILLIPSIFTSEAPRISVMTGLGGVVLVAALAARRLRPSPLDTAP